MCNDYTRELGLMYHEDDDLYGIDHDTSDIMGQKTCDHLWNFDDPVPACEKCALVGDVLLIDTYQENKPIRRHIKHDTKEYMTKKMNKLGGLDKGVLRFMRPTFRYQVRQCKTWPQVYDVCVRHGVNDSFLCVPAYMGSPLDITCIFKSVEDIVYTKNYRVQYMYVIHKLFQLWGQDAVWVPLKVTKPTLIAAEKEWVRVCVDYGIPCKKTCMSDLKTPWSAT